ncbi:hypothetical protein OSTOST_18371 [Ostertagia ostertagi]
MGHHLFIEDLPIQDFVMECSARPMICSSTRFEFDMWKTEKTDDVGSFLRVSHPEQVRKKYFYDMSFKEHRHKYLTQASFTNNVMYSTAFTKKGVSVYLMEFDHGPVQIHASDMPYFIGLHMRNFTADDELVDRFYAKSFLNFIHGRKPDKDWLPFDPSKRNYYSVEANFSKGIFPSNKMDYHSEIVDYWLHNMTAFDRSLSKKAAIQLLSEQIDVTPSHSIFRTALSGLLFGLSLALVFFNSDGSMGRTVPAGSTESRASSFSAPERNSDQSKADCYCVVIEETLTKEREEPVIPVHVVLPHRI